MNNLEKISAFLDNRCDIAFTPLQLSTVYEQDTPAQKINQQKTDYLLSYILISKSLAFKLQYKIQQDELEFFILDAEKIKKEPIQLKEKNLYLAKDKQEFFSFCESTSQNNKEIKGFLPLFLSNSKRQFVEKFPTFLLECEMILKQKNVLLQAVAQDKISMPGSRKNPIKLSKLSSFSSSYQSLVSYATGSISPAGLSAQSSAENKNNKPARSPNKI